VIGLTFLYVNLWDYFKLSKKLVCPIKRTSIPGSPWLFVHLSYNLGQKSVVQTTGPKTVSPNRESLQKIVPATVVFGPTRTTLYKIPEPLAGSRALWCNDDIDELLENKSHYHHHIRPPMFVRVTSLNVEILHDYRFMRERFMPSTQQPQYCRAFGAQTRSSSSIGRRSSSRILHRLPQISGKEEGKHPTRCVLWNGFGDAFGQTPLSTNARRMYGQLRTNLENVNSNPYY
jgi:hypothetical protein